MTSVINEVTGINGLNARDAVTTMTSLIVLTRHHVGGILGVNKE